jgi:hypothetical protein
MRARPSRLSPLSWRKSSASNPNGECVEIASTGSGVLMRDSSQPSGFLLACTPAQWSAFLRRVRSGELSDGRR